MFSHWKIQCYDYNCSDYDYNYDRSFLHNRSFWTQIDHFRQFSKFFYRFIAIAIKTQIFSPCPIVLFVCVTVCTFECCGEETDYLILKLT